MRAPSLVVAWGLALLLPQPLAAAEPPPAPAPAAARALLEGLPPDLAARLHERGFVLFPSAEDGLVESLVLFQRPPDVVFSLISQPERQAEFRSALGEITLLEKWHDGWLEEQHARVLFVSLRYRLRWACDADARTLAWHTDPAFENSVDHVSGTWQLLPLDGDRTLGRFATRVRIGSALPVFVQERLTRRNLRASLDATRRWVDSDGAWRP